MTKYKNRIRFDINCHKQRSFLTFLTVTKRVGCSLRFVNIFLNTNMQMRLSDYTAECLEQPYHNNNPPYLNILKK